MPLLHCYFISILSCFLRISATTLTPFNDVQVCPASSTSSEQIVTLLCNVTEQNPFIFWNIRVNGFSTNINFGATSTLNINRYRGAPGIEILLTSTSNYHLTSVAKIQIPPFDVARYSTKLTCNRITRSILPAAVPDPPLNISVQFSNYQENEYFTASLMWSSSNINDITHTNSSYYIIIDPIPNNTANGLTKTNAHSLSLILLKNTTYNVSIQQINCAGASEIGQTIISLLNYLQETTFCAVPVPLNGQLVDYTRTSWGSTLKYQCEYGFLPQRQLVSQCNIDGKWEPDPTEHNCSLADGDTTTAEESVKTVTTLKTNGNNINLVYMLALSGVFVMTIIGMILFGVTKRAWKRPYPIFYATYIQATVEKTNKNYKDCDFQCNTEDNRSPVILQNEAYDTVCRENTVKIENMYDTIQ